eukprot:7376290-Prymnesium_polylepis.1
MHLVSSPRRIMLVSSSKLPSHVVPDAPSPHVIVQRVLGGGAASSRASSYGVAGFSRRRRLRDHRRGLGGGNNP